MATIQTKQEILEHLEKSRKDFFDFCSSISSTIFFRQPVEKWSIAQNVSHLITSANMTRLAYRLPKFIVRIYAGKPNRPSLSYDELVTKYQLKLQQGGRASGRFVAKPVDEITGKEKVLDSFNKSMEILISTINNKWKDTQLDQYLAPHPLLGKLTLRELCYFTIYHTEHHLHIIKERLND